MEWKGYRVWYRTNQQQHQPNYPQLSLYPYIPHQNSNVLKQCLLYNLRFRAGSLDQMWQGYYYQTTKLSNNAYHAINMKASQPAGHSHIPFQYKLTIQIHIGACRDYWKVTWGHLLLLLHSSTTNLSLICCITSRYLVSTYLLLVIVWRASWLSVS